MFSTRVSPLQHQRGFIWYTVKRVDDGLARSPDFPLCEVLLSGTFYTILRRLTVSYKYSFGENMRYDTTKQGL